MRPIEIRQRGAASSERGIPARPGAAGTATPLRRWVVLLALGAVLVPVAWLWSSVVSNTLGRPLPVLARVPDFSLTESSGQAVTSDDLRGVVWLADFIFTTCAGPCPELTLRMHGLQQSLKRRSGDVRLVSFTLDPGYDTPKVLKAYARRSGADPELWWFLTGDDEPAIRTLVEEGFLQTVVPKSDENPIIHSTYFVLVDRAGRIRGFYQGLESASMPRILNDIDKLLREPARQ